MSLLHNTVKLLEADVKEIKSDLKTIMGDLRKVKGKLSNMPTTFQMIGMVLGIMGATFAFIRFGLGALPPTP